MVLFSSVAGRYGNRGQCDYAAANEVLNKVAQYEKQKRGNSCLVKSINWGLWDGGMVTPELKALFLQRNIHIIPQALGVKFFMTELLDKENSDVEVVYGGQLTQSDSASAGHHSYSHEKFFTVDESTDFI